MTEEVKKITVLDRIRHGFEALRPRHTIFLNYTEQAYGKSQDLSYADLADAFKGADLAQVGVHNMSAETVSRGFDTVLDEKYTHKVDGVSAKEFIDKWNKDNRVDELLDISATDMIAYGIAVWVPAGIDGVRIYPIRSIDKPIATDNGSISIYEKFWLQATADIITPGSTSRTVILKDFIMFRINVDSDSYPVGRGVMQRIMTTRDSNIPSSLVMNETIRKIRLLGLERNSWADLILSFPGASEAQLKTWKAAIETNIKAAIAGKGYVGSRIVTSAKADIQSGMINGSKEFDQFMSDALDLYLMGINDPMVKMIINGQFSEASVRGVIALHKSIIRQYQRAMGRELERHWEQKLKDAFYEPGANIKCVWREDLDVQEQTGAKSPEQPQPEPVKEPTPKPEPIIEQKQEALKEPPEPQKVDVNITVKVEADPIKSTVEIKTEPLTIKTEPIRTELTVKSEPTRVEIQLKEPEKNTELEQERLQLLKKLADKVGNR